MDKKTAKKARKLQERIDLLENEIKTSLGKKANGGTEIDVASHMRKIHALNVELKGLG
jgi:hypothetical protein